jgi:hypothetical protein
LRQPALGVVSSVLVITVSVGFISLFPLDTFVIWVAVLMICFIPMEIVIAVSWGSKFPQFIARRPQPLKGTMLTLLALVAGAAVSVFHISVIGGGVTPPPPMLAMCIIASVVVTFWFSIVWGGWPFTTLIRNPITAGLSMLIASYLANYLLFRLFFNFEFMSSAPVYVSALDPHGVFNAWSALVFYLSAISVMFLMLNLDLWPLTQSARLMRQPLLGIVWTGILLALGGSIYYLGVKVVGMEAPVFMVRVPIPFIFGTIIVQNVLQGSLFRRFVQPARGLFNVAAALAIGVVLSRMFAALAPLISGPATSGKPDYQLETWLASALLAVTFPFLIFFAEFFQFWPLKRTEGSKAARGA